MTRKSGWTNNVHGGAVESKCFTKHQYRKSPFMYDMKMDLEGISYVECAVGHTPGKDFVCF
jgi:hypothetical protein